VAIDDLGAVWHVGGDVTGVISAVAGAGAGAGFCGGAWAGV
jgi:hypothetical protein